MFLIVVLTLMTVLLMTGECLITSNPIGLAVGNRGRLRIRDNSALLGALSSGKVFLSSTYNNGNSYNRYGYRMMRNNNRVLPSRGNRFDHGRRVSR